MSDFRDLSSEISFPYRILFELKYPLKHVKSDIDLR